MTDFSTLLNKNKEEAIEILKKNGNSIDFVEGGEDWTGNGFEANLPCVFMSHSGMCIEYVPVLAVRLYSTNIVFIVQLEDGTADINYDDCISTSANEVYLYLEQYYS